MQKASNPVIAPLNIPNIVGGIFFRKNKHLVRTKHTALRNLSLTSIALHCTTQQYTLHHHCTAIVTVLRCTAFHFISLYYTSPLHTIIFTALYHTTLPVTSVPFLGLYQRLGLWYFTYLVTVSSYAVLIVQCSAV